MGRCQSVRVNNQQSEPGEVKSGIPQGSVLGPLLFIFYINDLPESVLSNLFLFADNIKVARSIRNLVDALQLQEDIKSLENWSNVWLLKFYPNKVPCLSPWKAWQHQSDMLIDTC